MTGYLNLFLIALLASFGLAQTGSKGGNSVCAQWCAANFRDPGSVCTAPAAKRSGPCYVCGPLKTSATAQLCNGACTETKSDDKNCGTCGFMCPAGSKCSSGSCKCTNSGRVPCNGACPDLTNDNNNCGTCGNTCPSGTTCRGGACTLVCTSPRLLCGGTCVDALNDPNNCGACVTVCRSGSCQNGACTAVSCTGQTCDTFTSCGPGGSCVCASTSEGTGFCSDGQTPCAGLADCNSNNDCSPGMICAVGTCCTRNVCIEATSCGNSDQRRDSMHWVRGGWVGATIAKPSSWVF